MSVILTLGGVTFRGFEVPETIGTGGEQSLVIHKLPGGARVINAMGADHRDIQWSGRFRGGDAESRARRLDGLRIGGQVQSLAWSGYRYRVVIKSFEAQFNQPFEIPYSLACVVQSDESAPLADTPPGLDETIGADLGKLLGLSAPLSLATVTDAVTSVQSVVATVGSLRAASKAGIGSLAGAIINAQATTQGAITQISESLGLSTPTDPAALAVNLSGQAAALGQLNQLYQATSTLGRMAKNLSNASH